MWHVGKFIALHDETATTRPITLEVSGRPGHIAGQHVDVRLTAAHGYSTVRSYSIASAPNFDNCIELTIERFPTRRRCFDTATAKIRRHCLKSLIDSEFTIGPVLALKLDQVLGSSGESPMKGFKIVNRKFSTTLKLFSGPVVIRIR